MIKAKYKHGKYIMLTLESGSRILEHRFVMEEFLGRKLIAGEVIHHKNDNGTDNSIGNLELMTFSSHASKHVSERWAKFPHTIEVICPECKETFTREIRVLVRSKKINQLNFCSHKCSGMFSARKHWKR